MNCWLEGHGKCAGPIQNHHLLNKSKFPRKIRERRDVKNALLYLLVPVCAHHNDSKIADTPWARKILLQRLIQERGRDWVEWVFEEVLGKMKVRSAYADMEIDAILSGPDPT